MPVGEQEVSLQTPEGSWQMQQRRVIFDQDAAHAIMAACELHAHGAVIITAASGGICVLPDGQQIPMIRGRGTMGLAPVGAKVDPVMVTPTGQVLEQLFAVPGMREACRRWERSDPAKEERPSPVCSRGATMLGHLPERDQGEHGCGAGRGPARGEGGQLKRCLIRQPERDGHCRAGPAWLSIEQCLGALG